MPVPRRDEEIVWCHRCERTVRRNFLGQCPNCGADLMQKSRAEEQRRLDELQAEELQRRLFEQFDKLQAEEQRRRLVESLKALEERGRSRQTEG